MRFLILAACLLFPMMTHAETFVIAPDGTGDFPTIQAAIDAASDGDAIKLLDGVFRGDGNRDVDNLGKAVAIESVGGDPASCIIDCEGTDADPHRGFVLSASEVAGPSLAAVTIRNGWVVFPERGGAILCSGSVAAVIRSCMLSENCGTALRCDQGSSTRLVDCTFTDNEGPYGGAIDAYGGSLDLQGCVFERNHTDGFGGAIHCYWVDADLGACRFIGNTAESAAACIFQDESTVDVFDCLFDGNISAGGGGALSFWISGPNTVERCTFLRNTSVGGGAALSSEKICDTVVRNCTFWRNASPAGTIWAGNFRFVMQNTIVAGDELGPAVASPYDYAELSCCDLFGNAGGDWVGSIADQFGIDGNICADPLFCDPENNDLYLDAESPCAPFSPENPECDLVGAWPVGCGATPIETTSWGAIRGLFR